VESISIMILHLRNYGRLLTEKDLFILEHIMMCKNCDNIPTCTI